MFTDSDTNMIAAINKISYKHIPYFTHLLNTILQNNLSIISCTTTKNESHCNISIRILFMLKNYESLVKQFF